MASYTRDAITRDVAEAVPRDNATRWTTGKIVKRIIIGISALVLFVGLAAWILHVTTDPLSDRREARLAAAETWRVLTVGAAPKPGPLAGPVPDLLLVRPASYPDQDIDGLTRALRHFRSTPAGSKALMLVLIDRGEIGVDHDADEGVDRGTRIVSRFLAAGADGIVVDFTARAAVAPPRFQTVRKIIQALRQIEPTMLVLAHAPEGVSLSEPFAGQFDGLVRVSPTTVGRVNRVSMTRSRPVVFRDWHAGRTLLVLKTDQDKPGDVATRLDFLPQTRLP
ncbi:MAG: hypothetical protein AAF732_15390 [Pseudomonadota bacterium]